MNRNNIRPFLCGMLASLALCVCATTALADFSPANPLKFNTLNMRVAGKLVLREDETLTSDNGATFPPPFCTPTSSAAARPISLSVSSPSP